MQSMKMSCPCHFGLEGILSGELKRMGAKDIVVTDGRVQFSGEAVDMVRANLWLRTAERVQIVLGEFKASSFEELFDGVRALELEQYIGKEDAFPVKGFALNSQLYSIPDCQSIIKKAAVERLKEVYGISWFEETGPKVQINFAILKDVVTIMLDTSGVGLHKRGYRDKSNAAPIKETLAAGIADLAWVRPDSVLYDPLCGSGTMLIEACYKALNVAPGIRRRFAAEKWGSIPAEIWAQERSRAKDLVRRDASLVAYGSDIDPAAIELTRDNVRKAGVSGRVKLEQLDVKDFAYKSEQGIVLTNPPYGERMLELSEAEQLYAAMGKVLEKNDTHRCYIISPHEEFERMFGKTADKRRKLYNGMIKCQLYMYFK